MPVPTLADAERRPIAVVGAGTLGRAIAAMLAGHGASVRLYDVAPAQLAAAGDEAAAVIADLRAAGATPGALTTTDDLRAAVADVWLVIEAVPERLELKQAVFAELDELAPPDALLASNSSSLRSALLIGEVAKPERVLNAHFYHPPRWNAVELMTCGATDPAAIALLMTMFARYGLEPFRVQRESTGFIYNRVWAAIKREALLVVAEGVATPEDVDRLFRSAHDSPMGPFEMMDRVGLDVVLDIEEVYARERDGIPAAPRALLRRMIAAGKLGVKSGEGFYRY